MNNVLTDSHDDAPRNRMIRLVPHALAVLGVALSVIDSRFLLIAVAGIFGPGLLTELGWLKPDEFQRETRLRASHHSFLMGGVFLALVISFNGVGQRYSAEMHKIDDAVPASLVLTLMLAVYYLSGLVRYWGPQKAAFRIIIAYALVFAGLVGAASIKVGSATPGFNWSGLLQVLAFAIVMTGAAFHGRKHPRAAALILLAPTGWLVYASDTWSWFNSSSVPWEVSFDVIIFTLLLPVTGIVAFLAAGRVPEDSE